MRGAPTASRRRRLVAAGLGSAVLLLAAGCSGGGGDGSASAPPPCNSPGVTSEEVKVGLIYPDSGPLANVFAAARGGFEARIGLANDSGGVHGRTVRVVWADDAGAQEKNGSAARQLVERDGVFAIAELSTAASGSAQYLADAGIPVVGLAAEREWNDYDNMFAQAYIHSSGGSVTTFGMFAKAQGGTKVAVVEEALTESVRVLSDQMIASMRGQGVELAARIPYTVGQSSPARTVQAIADSGADVLIVQTPIEGLREIVAASRQAGVSYKAVLSSVAYDKTLLAQAGADLAGVTAVFEHIPWESDSPALRQFRDAVARYSPATTDPDQVTVLASYVVGDMLLRGLELAGECPTREAFHSKLRALTNYEAAGLIPGGIDLSSNRGRMSLCFTFATVNAEGTAYQVVPSPSGGEQWCGTRFET